ncbi:MAG: AAA family ATPase [Phycisphaeraceae bacterium]|nr:MAG: AAA family ATPase [Phycisphaeraceae bacterium]
MRRIAIVNQKGGCGKTTTAINLAGILARKGMRTLLVDMDPQGHCAAGLAIPEQRIDLDIGDAMLAPADQPVEPSRLIWRVSRNLDLLPSRTRVAGLEAARGGLADQTDSDQRLSRVLDRFADRYDVCCIDCSPSIGLLTYNALVAAHFVLVPVETSFFSLQGAAKQLSTIQSLSRRVGTGVPTWLLATIHDPASALARDLLEELHRRYEQAVCPVVIHHDMALREAASFGLPVVDYAPECPGAQDYAALADWLRERFDSNTEPDHARGAEPATKPTGSVTSTKIAHPVPASVHHEPDPGLGRVSHDDRDPEQPLEVVNRPRKPVPASRRVAPSGQAAMTPEQTQLIQEHAPAAESFRHGATSPHEPETTNRSIDVARRAAAIARTRTDGIGDRTHKRPARSTPRPASEFGAHAAQDGVHFIQPTTVGRRVIVSGDFNNWSDSEVVLALDETRDVLAARVELPPGVWQYRLIIDGRWTPDPYNPHAAPNPFGELNSIVVVQGTPTSTLPSVSVNPLYPHNAQPS